MRENSRFKSLIGDAHTIMPLSQLPKPFQMAIVWYMAVDGCAWEDIELPETQEDMVAFKQAVEDAIPEFVRRYGDRKFGIVNIPVEQFKQSMMQGTEIGEDFSTFDEYHQWYLSHGDTPEYDSEDRWPVILSDFGDEVTQDGAHRLHSYIRAQHTDIPALFFPSP